MRAYRQAKRKTVSGGILGKLPARKPKPSPAPVFKPPWPTLSEFEMNQHRRAVITDPGVSIESLSGQPLSSKEERQYGEWMRRLKREAEEDRRQGRNVRQGRQKAAAQKAQKVARRDLEMALEYVKMERRQLRLGRRPKSSAIKAEIGKQYELGRTQSIVAINRGLKKLPKKITEKN
jgi:hypothetical protein